MMNINRRGQLTIRKGSWKSIGLPLRLMVLLCGLWVVSEMIAQDRPAIAPPECFN